MRAVCLLHVPFEGPGHIAAWMNGNGWSLELVPLYAGAALPAPATFDGLVVMGGPMSVHDEREFPWLVAEQQTIREAIAAGKPVLGICLGAQLIARAMGGEVMPNAQKEIGWWPIRSVAEEGMDTFRFADELEVFHWHGETFTLPPGAVRLAESAACRNQAFQLGRRVIGLQFHLETTPDTARALIEHARHELTPAPFVQGETRLLSVAPEQYVQLNRVMDDVLTYLLVNP